MDEHPVPRNISGFQFQLIGFMTLKQFIYLLFGFGLAFAFFKAPLSVFRIPLALLCAFVGIAFAFIPIQERPLEIWLKNLIRSVYSPTQFIWVKSSQIPNYFSFRATTKQTEPKKQQEHEEMRSKLTAYLASVAPKNEQLLDRYQEQTLHSINTLMGISTTQKTTTVTQQNLQPSTGLSSISTIANRLLTHQMNQPQQKPIHEPTINKHQSPTLAPGIIAGLIKTGEGALSGALIHITKDSGEEVRLLKSNTEGKFSLNLPLSTGRYLLTVEDPNKSHRFKPVSFSVSNTGFHPWLLREEA